MTIEIKCLKCVLNWESLAVVISNEVIQIYESKKLTPNKSNGDGYLDYSIYLRLFDPSRNGSMKDEGPRIRAGRFCRGRG